MFEVQVQGRFKKAPEGDLYISLEITERMKLGFLTKVLAIAPPCLFRVLLSASDLVGRIICATCGCSDGVVDEPDNLRSSLG